jgi:uncharacterized tellurite resistance protein B-like protein
MMVIDKIRGWLDQDKSVRMVAEDIQLTSELILLVRMMFADGTLRPEELDNFKNICRIAFDIPAEDVPKVIEYLQDFGYETSVSDAAAMFEGMEWERKKTLLVHLLSIAKSDNLVHDNEAELLRRISDLLDVTADDIAELRKA